MMINAGNGIVSMDLLPTVHMVLIEIHLMSLTMRSTKTRVELFMTHLLPELLERKKEKILFAR